MFKLDQQVFKFIYDFCKSTGEGFGFGVLEGFFINFTVIAGVVLVAINSKGVKQK